jgi:hypothetical protein
LITIEKISLSGCDEKNHGDASQSRRAQRTNQERDYHN